MLGLVMVVTSLALAGCGEPANSSGSGAAPPATSQPAPPAKGAPWMRGVVTQVSTTKPVTRDCVSESSTDPDGTVSSDDPPVCNPNPDSYGSFMVKGSVQGEQGKTPASVAVAKTVTLADQDGRRIAWTDITKGSNVSVWITGEVMESYPVQVRATHVVLGQAGESTGRDQGASDERPPDAALVFDHGTVKIRPYGYCWASVGSGMCADGMPAKGKPKIDVDRGAMAHLAFSDGTPTRTVVSVSPKAPDPGSSHRLEVGSGETVTFDLAPGIWYVSIFTRWREGDASYSAPIRITP
jgi:hypothetical protein